MSSLPTNRDIPAASADTMPSMNDMEFPMEDAAPLQMDTPTYSHDAQHGGLFFADALLDLEEAQGLAETPQPPKLVMEMASSSATSAFELPDLKSPLRALSPSASISSTDNSHQNIRSNSNNKDGIQLPLQRIEASRIYQRQPLPTNHRPRPPRRPRDIPWLVAFYLFVPLALVICTSLRRSTAYGNPIALNAMTERASLYAIFLAYLGTLLLARLLYRTSGGGEGDDARHVASQFIMAFAPISLGIHPLLMLLIYRKTPKAIHYALIPLWFLLRDVWAMRQWRTTASTAGGRQAFFQALVNMALDILSRSLRRSSFYRIVIIVLTLQFVVTWWWQSALLGALGHGSAMWFFVAFVAGKWATGTMARILGLIASGGVTSWFAQQSLLMESMEHAESGPTRSANANMPEEYRTADASAYQPVVPMGLNDDDDDEDDFENGQVSLATMTMMWEDSGSSTVKAFLISALTTSFGSVAQCGLLGGLAQFVWSILRNLEGLSSVLSQRFPSQYRGFRGMQIGNDTSGASGVIAACLTRAHITARNFVRAHSDLAMCQVAANYKSYQRAAQDVAVLVDGSGVEPILHDDITTHMCACLCGSIAGMVIIFFGLILDHHQLAHHLSDTTVVQSMLLAFVLCYVMLFTVMEPLRAAIKAVYVCFAQHPESLSQAFPLIFHRLTRISEANLV